MFYWLDIVSLIESSDVIVPSCANTCSNTVGIPAINTNTRMDVITIELVFEFIYVFVWHDI